MFCLVELLFTYPVFGRMLASEGVGGKKKRPTYSTAYLQPRKV